ncbi:FXYD domain-containing ion transport regulator 6-like isoform X2 [Nerophis ophidion]|uniref:FXYD domain-containing ion transport regulator 6-like isoform X2 n=1 Tax=Nerophis ophidion TaxID=159077 RepID=UPI002AE09D82|nr:FXYD domain-containing ion transport regulator 6-like isoform X2 [Nerophis ophidion]
MEAVLFVAFISWMTPALVAAADGDKYDDSAFQYDYESLRIGGLVFAAVLFLLGVALIVSRKCACSKSGKSRSRDPNAESGVPREAIFPEQRDFEYDEDTLRTTGMVLAIIMFVSGILIALSKKCTKCVKSSPKSADTQIPKTEVPPPAV